MALTARELIQSRLWHSSGQAVGLGVVIGLVTLAVLMDEDSRHHQPRYVEIDVSERELSGDEPLGTKPKRWLVNPATGERWLMKDATFNRLADGSEYRKGDDWAERIACGVAAVLDLPAARVELCVDHKGDEDV